MRFVARQTLNQRLATYLTKAQGRLERSSDPEGVWKRARATKTMQEILSVLWQMTPPGGRCMYCRDSHGGDVEHFWPRNPHRSRTFVWENLLAACADCNRQKGNRFPLDATDNPLLIDPSIENPWTFLLFVPATGRLQARYVPGVGDYDPKGVASTSPTISRLNDECVTEGRLREVRLLKADVKMFLEGDLDEQELRQRIFDHDQFGLIEWFLLREGAQDEPFRALGIAHHRLTQELKQELRQKWRLA